MKHIKLFENYNTIPNYNDYDGYLYHGTSTKFNKNLLNNGIVADPYSYWGSYDIALYYANGAVDEVGGRVLIIAIPFKNFDKKLFTKDINSIAEPITTVLGYSDDELEEMWGEVKGTWLDCLNIYQSICYNGLIKPKKDDIISE